MGFWSGIKHALNSTLGTSGFSPLDKIVKDSTHIVDENVKRLRGGVQTFTSNGTFTVPEGVTKILVTACAGGQAGEYIKFDGGDGGAGGDWIFKEPYSVISGQSISITVGKGGISGGAIGTPTVIGQLVTLACPGSRGGNGGSAGRSSKDKPEGLRGSDGFACGGNGTSGSTNYDGGGGGGGSLGRGGDSGGREKANGVLGGGGGGSTDNEDEGKGGDGIVIIEW